MPIEFRCTGCQRLLRTADDTAGKQARCPECGAIMVVPGTAPVPAEAAPQATPTSEIPSAPSGAPSGPVGRAVPERPYEPLSSDVRAYAASRVAGPSTALIVAAAIGLVWTLNNLAHIDAVERMFRAQRIPFPFPIGPFAAGMGALQIVSAIVILIGAVKMKRLESYGLAMASAILAMIPCTFGACCVLGLPFGIWALVVLSDIHVRSAFRS